MVSTPVALVVALEIVALEIVALEIVAIETGACQRGIAYDTSRPVTAWVAGA
jgi:hypothetical protein